MSNTIKVLKGISQQKENERQRNFIEVPKESLNISRSHMPQINSKKRNEFLNSLEREGVSHQYVRIAPIHLKATQSEFNLDKVRTIMKTRPALAPAIISKDNFILDGHHRWLSDYNTDRHEPGPVLKINLPILDLLARARRFDGVEFRTVQH